MKPPGTRVWRMGGRSLLWRPRSAAICALLILLAGFLALGLLGSGTMTLSPEQIWAGLSRSGGDLRIERVLWRIRLPRVATAGLVGAALGMSGAIFQSLTRNPLGSPDVIGFTTGAATGAIVRIMLIDAAPGPAALAAVGAGLATAAAVLLLARHEGETGGQRLILVGIGVGATLGGANTALLVMGDLERALSAQIWLAGSLNARSWAHALPAAAGLCVFAPMALLSLRGLALMEMDDATARRLGASPERLRLILVLAAVGLTSVGVASAGPIAFVALAGPQIARRLTRSPDPPLLSGALTGAVLLMAADLLSQRVPLNLLLPIGLTTGLLGGLYLLWILVRSESGR